MGRLTLIGGIPFTRGPLAHFLRNRFYIGEVASRARSSVRVHPSTE
jgi:hypothetical protein